MADIACLNEKHGDHWTAYNGDCVDIVRQLPDNSVDLSVYSPPFSGLYIYNDSVADMGNSANDGEFYEHYKYLVKELFRVMRPGRMVAVHCKDLVYYRTQRETAGLRDFPGELVKIHMEAGFDFHSRITIWRCPVREMTKTKAHGLLYKQLRSDSSFSRQGLPEYFMVFRKWAKTEDDQEYISPISHTTESFPLSDWQEYASPVWMNTRETDVLNAKRGPKDEKHICPMPLDLTERVVKMWSNPNDVVLSPFMGIGSEGYVSTKMKRRFVGVELKQEYFNQAINHLTSIEDQRATLFDDVAA
jgi:DNA modification methylase